MSSSLAKRIKHGRYVNEADQRQLEEELIVVGYSCTLFRDDEKAEMINEERHLIAHPVDDSLTTDRYDGRLCLHDLHLYDSGKIQRIRDSHQDEKCIDDDVDVTELEIERYRDLIAADDDYEEDNYEPSATSPVEFTDANSNGSRTSSPSGEQRKEKYRSFTPPPDLELPSGMQTPETKQMHAIIAKTAAFVAQKGPQMEIVIKAKQKTKDHHFEFLDFDHALRPYYDHVLSMIKRGRYQFVEEQEESDDDSDGGDYLHPSLMISSSSSTATTATTKQSQPPQEQTSEEGANVDLQPIMDRLAEYVARNGDAFENIVRSRQDPMYAFIEPDHEYNSYYRQRVNYYRTQYNQLAESKSLSQSTSYPSQRSASHSPLTICSSFEKQEKSVSSRDSPPPKRSKRSKHGRNSRRNSSDEDGDGTRSKGRRKRVKKSRASSKYSEDDDDDEEEEDDNDRKLSGSIKYATFVPVPASDESRDVTAETRTGEKECGNEDSPQISDNAVKSSLGVDSEEKDKSDESVRKIQEERRAKAKIFLRLIRDRDQNASKVVNPGTKPWDDD